MTEGLFSSTPSTVTARVIGNAVIGRDRQGGGISHTINAGSIDTQMLSNTVVDTRVATNFNRWSGSPGTGTITGTVSNNLIAFNNFGLLIDAEYQAGVAENYNLVFSNTSNSYTPGPNDVTADPMMRALNNPRLAQGSPAIEAGDSSATSSALIMAGLGQLDVDGLRRVKASAIDIGAYEYGDKSLLARADTVAFNYFLINHPATNGLPNARLFTVSNFGPTDEPPLPPLNAEPLGVWYSLRHLADLQPERGLDARGCALQRVRAQRWRGGVRTHRGGGYHHRAGGDQDQRQCPQQPEQDRSGDAELEPGWRARDLQQPPHFGRLLRALLVHPQRRPRRLERERGLQRLRPGSQPNAFVHTATAANIAGPGSSLDHPLLNGVRCAQVHVSRRGLSTLSVATTFDVFYNPAIQRWVIYNHNSVSMAVGAEFFVVVDPGQVFDCTDFIFKDGFQA